jgi:hypothetical protein
MTRWGQRGKLYSFLKSVNILVLICWLIYFADAFLPTHSSVEVVRDFNDFGFGINGGAAYKKLITGQRSFTVYARENDFFITDTLELRVTKIFGLVRQYRKLSTIYPSEWMYNKLSRYRNGLLLFLTIGLMLLTVYIIAFNPGNNTFKFVCLLNFTGAVVFFLSVFS